MVSVGDMVISSLSKVWHIVPIVIFIILFKRFINKKTRKQRIQKHEELENSGLTLELRTGEKYEKSGYEVIYKDENEDQGIDLFCKKDNKILLFKCNNSSESKSITPKDIKTFHDNAMEYIKSNDIQKNNVELRYVVLHKDMLDKTALKLLMYNSYNCKYVVL